MKSERFWHKILAVATDRKKEFFFIHLFYTLLGIILFAPLTGIVGRLFLKLSGQEVLSDMQIAGFLLSPLGFVAFILFFSLIVTIIIFEQASMQAVTIAWLKEEHLTALDSITFTLRHMKKIYLFSGRLILKLLFIMVPFLAVAGLVAFLLITEHDINYYLSQKPSEFITVVAINAVVILAMLLLLVKKLLSWSMALPLVLFSNISPADSFTKSEKMTATHKKDIFKQYAAWALVSILVSVVILGSIHFAGTHLSILFYDSLKTLVLVIGAVMLLLMVAHFFLTIFISSTFAALTVLLAEKYGASLKNEKLQFSQAATMMRLNKTKITIGLAAALLFSIFIGSALLTDTQTLRDVEIIAHRGAAGKAPENTLASMKQAIADKTDWIELDVQESKDGEVMVIHDSDVMKLANVGTKIWEGTKEELQQIDIGSWYDAKFSDETIPTLKEVLQLAKGKTKVLIELKYYGHDNALEQKVVDLVEAENMANDIAVMSLNRDQVKRFRALRPEWEAGILLSKTLGDISKIDANFLAVNLGMMGPNFIKRTHKTGKKIYVWTADDPITIFKMISLGVDGVITNEPELARNVLEESKKLNSVERLVFHVAALLGKPIPLKEYRDESP
ncbi:glycerophosphodiester phosphodiesterase family protein [Sulfurovum riftiae]|uniref:GP-PDE domain-containing protein n=1 Tax=Sulfurovum riftiae TaxID=1630136 RepID=A0A151CG42_9BACT|nr:glycerophosphodiester phosphodiesterase family protein [Sulfurovum riftiae]KYJ86512.1 hypothetical protein AS592_06815 [Sulfurovum riftiae]